MTPDAVKILSRFDHSFVDDAASIVQQGRMFHCSALATALADNANFDMMIIEAAAAGSSELSFYEGTVATGGTPETVFNVKRTSTRTWGGVMVTDPTVSDAGTWLLVQFMPGGSRNQATGGAASFDVAWVLKSYTSYLVRLTNRSGGAIRASIGCDHYASPQTADVN
jgi:hypothetical protein